MLARNRRPEREQAYQLWIKSKKERALKDIAAELNVTDAQVRKWKKQDNWEGKSKGTPKGTQSINQKVRGAPKGNQNAVGHGAPIGNKNNFKHGLFESIRWDILDEDEKQMLSEMPMDGEGLLIEQIWLWTVREHRLLKRIEEQKNIKSGLSLHNVVSRKLEITGDTKESHKETTTSAIASFDVIQKWEAELTRVQARKTRCIEALENLRIKREKAQSYDKDEYDKNTETEQQIMIYIPDNERDKDD